MIQAEKRLIDGNYAKSENVIAYCNLLTHRGFLSKTLVKSHDCLAKKCPFFHRLKPEYWESFERIEREKKNNRLRKKQFIKMTEERNSFIRETLENSGHIYVTSIKEESHIFTISYIYDKKIDLTPELQILRGKFKKSIRLSAKIGSEKVIEQLIRQRRK